MRKNTVALLAIIHIFFFAHLSLAGDWNTAGENVYVTTGNVGIGTDSPQGNLDVVGGTQIGPYLNLEEDVYGVWELKALGAADTCNSDRSNPYTCEANESRSCTDIKPYTSINDHGRTVKCIDDRFGISVRASGTVSIGVIKSEVGKPHPIWTDIFGRREQPETPRLTFDLSSQSGNSTIELLVDDADFGIGRQDAYRNDLTIKANNGNVGIGTKEPSAKLEVNGQIKITGGEPGEGKVLVSDANGLAKWEAPAEGFSGTVSLPVRLPCPAVSGEYVSPEGKLKLIFVNGLFAGTEIDNSACPR